jgi:hypothetical protein
MLDNSVEYLDLAILENGQESEYEKYQGKQEKGC